MKLLYLLPQLPWPPHSGGRIVTWNLISRLAKRHEVTVVALTHAPEDEENARVFRETVPDTHTFPAHRKWDGPVMLRSLVGATPYKVRRFHNRAMERKVRELLASGDTDVVHCQNFYTAQYVQGVRGTARVLYTENFESLLLERYAETKRNPLVKAAILWEQQRTQRYELKVCEWFDRTLAISALDCARFRKARPDLEFGVQPAGVDLEEYRPREGAADGKRVVFTGTLGYYPNADGVLWFAESVWPKIRQQHPEAVCQIVGAGPGERIQHLNGRDGIEVTGRVPDTRDYIGAAAAYVVPLRIGGGVRLKILEALAMGAPIVSTAVGAEGLTLDDGRDLLLADSPDEMAAAVNLLLQDANKRAELGRAARATAEARYGWDRMVEELETHYRHVTGHSGEASS